jgi:hypothetical protein
VAKVFIEHGTTAMPMVRNDPEEIAAPKSSGAADADDQPLPWHRPWQSQDFST